MQKKMICIACPNGCHLTVEKTDDKIEVTGNKCSKGEEYGKAEVTNPKRTVTAVVKTNIKEMPYVSVRTDKRGNFILTLPSPQLQPGGGLTGSYKIYYYVANYEYAVSTVLIRNGRFEYNSEDINKEGKTKTRACE